MYDFYLIFLKFHKDFTPILTNVQFSELYFQPCTPLILLTLLTTPPTHPLRRFVKQELALNLVERRLMTAEEKSKRAYDKEQAILEAAKVSAWDSGTLEGDFNPRIQFYPFMPI